MGCEGNDRSQTARPSPTCVAGTSHRASALVRYSANGTYGISHVSRSGKETGDDKENRDEVLAVTITPAHSEEPGHDVSGGGPERNEVE